MVKIAVNQNTYDKLSCIFSAMSLNCGEDAKWFNESTRNTVASWRQVVILLKMEGLMVKSSLFKNRINTPSRIRISRLMTTTVNHEGIKSFTESTTKVATRRILSARGSRKAPSLLFWSNNLAINPSAASLKLASTNRTRAMKCSSLIR